MPHSTPDFGYAYDELKGLSYSKVCDFMYDIGWMVYETLEPISKARYFDPTTVPYFMMTRGPYPWATNWVASNQGRFGYTPTDPQTGASLSVQGDEAGYMSNPCNDPYSVPAEMVCPNPSTTNDSLVHDLPVGSTGVLFTDGSNMLIIARMPGSDRIIMSKSWYHTVDTGIGQKLGEMVIKGLLGYATGGLSQIAIAVAQAGGPATPNRPVVPDIPDEYHEAFAPIDEVIAPVDPSGQQGVQNPVDNLPPSQTDATVKPFPWVGLLMAAGALLIS